MKLHADAPSHLNSITGYGPDWIGINAGRHAGSTLVMPEAVLEAWPVARFADLTAEHFARIAAHRPEVVLFGSGARLRFPPAAVIAPLRAAGIGIETMDLQAACRTYNILMAEGRRVGAALLLEASAPAAPA